MTGKPLQSTPTDASPYALLRNADAVVAGERAKLETAPAATNEFKAHADKIGKLLDALWHSFEAGPDAGLPNTIIDLTMAYTSALRMQLNLKAIATSRTNPKPPPAATPPASQSRA